MEEHRGYQGGRCSSGDDGVEDSRNALVAVHEQMHPDEDLLALGWGAKLGGIAGRAVGGARGRSRANADDPVVLVNVHALLAGSGGLENGVGADVGGAGAATQSVMVPAPVKVTRTIVGAPVVGSPGSMTSMVDDV